MDHTNQLDEMGHFWLARDEEREHAVGGRIIIDEQGVATLKVFSPLVPDSNSLLAFGLEQGPNVRVLGITETNNKITIDNASASSVGFAYGTGTGIDTRTFISNRVLIGALYEDKEEIRFHKVRFEIDYLFEWLSRSGLKEKARSVTSKPISMTVEYRAPVSMGIELGDVVSCDIHFGGNLAGVAEWSRSWDLTQECSIVFELKEGNWTFVDIDTYALWLQSFVAIVTGARVGISRQVAYSQSKLDANTESLLEMHLPRREFLRSEDVKATILPMQMPIAYTDIQNHFSTMLKNWRDLCHRDEQAIRLIMTTRYGEHSWPEHFMYLARAIDASVGKRLGKGVAFRDVVLFLASECEAEVDSDLDLQRFSDAVRVYRNWFTHFDRDGKALEVDYGEVRTLVYNLRAILDIYMLRQCLPEDLDYRDLIYQGKELKWALRQFLVPHSKHKKVAEEVPDDVEAEANAGDGVG